MLNLRDMMPQGARRTKRRRLPLPEALEVLTDEEANKLIDVERLQKDAIRRAEQAGIIFIDEIDKVAGREGGRPRPRRLARGRAARPAADRRGLDGVDEVRPAQDRPRAVHRRGRVPRLEAEGPDPRAAGALPDPRRARVADRRGLRPHPDRARERADQAVHGAAGDREGDARHPARRRRRDRAHRHAGQRAHGEHRRAPPAHDHGARARRPGVRGARARRRRRSRSPPPTCASASTGSSRTRISRSTSSEKRKRAAPSSRPSRFDRRLVEPPAGAESSRAVTSCCRARGPGPCAPASARGGRRPARPCWGRATRRPSSCRRRRRGRRPWTGRDRPGRGPAGRYALPPPIGRRVAAARLVAGRRAARRRCGRAAFRPPTGREAVHRWPGRRAAVSRRRVAARRSDRASRRAPCRARPPAAASSQAGRQDPRPHASRPAPDHRERDPPAPGAAGAAAVPARLPPAASRAAAPSTARPAAAPRQPLPAARRRPGVRRRTRRRAAAPAAAGGGAVEVAALPRQPGGRRRRRRGATAPAARRGRRRRGRACRASCVCAGCDRQTVGAACGVPRQAAGGAPR